VDSLPLNLVLGAHVVITHPFLKLSSVQLRLGASLLGAAFAIATGVFLWAVPLEDIDHVTQLVESSPVEATRILDSWSPKTRETFQFMLGYDFLYDLIHNNLVALILAGAAIRYPAMWSHLVASLLCWVMWLDTGLNIFENLAYNYVLSSNTVEPWHRYASIIFQFRTSTLVLGLVVALAIHVLGLARRQVA